MADEQTIQRSRLAPLLGICCALICACSSQEGRPFARGFEQQQGENAIVECSDAGLIAGVDVSKYDGAINWPEAADAGLVFAIARVSDGDFDAGFDTYFDSNWRQMKQVGLIRGVYQYFEPDENPDTEAQLLLNHIPDWGPGDLPPVIDVETLDGLDGGTAYIAVNAWVQHIAQALNTRPIIYTSERVWDMFGDQTLEADLWVANWQVSCPAIPNAWTTPGWTMWQYTATGTVNGIGTGACDLDRFNGTLAQLKTYVNFPEPGDGGTDGGVQDGGTSIPDGGAVDAGPIDGGTSPDAGAPDSGPADSGPADSGTIDPGLTATLVNPVDGATLIGEVSLQAIGTDSASLEIYLDGALFATGHTSSLTVAWDTKQSADGSHELHAVAFSQAGVEADSASAFVVLSNHTDAGSCPLGDVLVSGSCDPIVCATGSSLDGGLCVPNPPLQQATSSGCSGTNNGGWIVLLVGAACMVLRRKRTLHELGQPW